MATVAAAESLPAEAWQPLSVTTAGLPVLLDEEVELKRTERVSIQSNRRDVHPPATVVLTNMRVLYLSASTRLCCMLEQVEDCVDCATMLHRSKRVTLVFVDNRDWDLKFFEGGKEDFLTKTLRALERKAWTVLQEKQAGPSAAKPDEPEVFSTRKAGLAGLQRRQEKNQANASRLTSEALGDLNSLLEHAREAAAVVNRYASFMAAQAHDDGVSQVSGYANPEAGEVEQLLQGVGLASPVTKLTAGRAYHEQLARQLADLLLAENRIRRLGSMMTMTDVYCFYNRARGTDLVSPQDLVQAAELLQGLNLGLHVSRLPSGVLVLQVDDFDPAQMNARIADIAASAAGGGGLHSMALARELNVSAVLAREYLLTAEKAGAVCRDDSTEGLSFYPNQFAEYAQAAEAAAAARAAR